MMFQSFAVDKKMLIEMLTSANTLNVNQRVAVILLLVRLQRAGVEVLTPLF